MMYDDYDWPEDETPQHILDEQSYQSIMSYIYYQMDKKIIDDINKILESGLLEHI